jgi:lipopolysaccharide transport system permease protein
VPPISVAAIPVRVAALVMRALSPRANARAFGEGVALLRSHPRLIFEMAREDLTGRYRGQLLGSAWALIHPLAMALLYLFIFGVVMSQRVGGTREMPLSYTAYLLSGLIPWLTFQTSILSSVTAITGNSALVKQFIFPIEVLPVRDVVSSLVTWFVGMAATLSYVFLREGAVQPTWALLPIVLAAQCLAMIGVAFLFSAIAVFFRDIKDFINLFTLVAMFLMPVVYLPGWVPEIFRPVIWINPFTYMVWVYQDVIYFGRIEHPMAWVLYFLGAPLVFAWGARTFRATKPLYSSVL